MSPLDQKTAFGELSVAEPTIEAQVSFPYNINTDIVSTTLANGGTAVVTDGNLELSTSTNAAGSAQLTSKRVLRYGPGQGALIRFTAIFTKGVANSTQIIGIGDDQDGFYIGYNGTEFGFLRRAAGVDHWTKRADWDSSQSSGERGVFRSPVLSNDPTMGNVYQIRYQWLGYGQICVFMEDPETGGFELIHRVAYADANTVPSIQNPTLPLCAEVKNAGNTTDLVLKSASMMAAIEGKEAEVFTRHSASQEKLATVTEAAVITIRNRSTFASVTNRVQAVIDFMVFSIDTGGLHRFRLVAGATIGGTPSFTDISTNTSVMEVDVAGTTVTGGRELMSAISSGGAVTPFNASDLDLRLNPGEFLTVSIQKLQGQATDVGVSMSWKELF